MYARLFSSQNRFLWALSGTIAVMVEEDIQSLYQAVMFPILSVTFAVLLTPGIPIYLANPSSYLAAAWGVILVPLVSAFYVLAAFSGLAAYVYLRYEWMPMHPRYHVI